MTPEQERAWAALLQIDGGVRRSWERAARTGQNTAFDAAPDYGQVDIRGADEPPGPGMVRVLVMTPNVAETLLPGIARRLVVQRNLMGVVPREFILQHVPHLAPPEDAVPIPAPEVPADPEPATAPETPQEPPKEAPEPRPDRKANRPTPAPYAATEGDSGPPLAMTPTAVHPCREDRLAADVADVFLDALARARATGTAFRVERVPGGDFLVRATTHPVLAGYDQVGTVFSADTLARVREKALGALGCYTLDPDPIRECSDDPRWIERARQATLFGG